MKQARLKIKGEKDFLIEDEMTSIGRASDNKISLAEDSNVSRYHAEIEIRNSSEFWLIELGSSNGTTVNGKPVETEFLLRDGDLIVLGGTSEIEFQLEEKAPEDDEKLFAANINSASTSASSPVGATSGDAAQITPEMTTVGGSGGVSASKMPLMLIVTGLACGLAVIFVAAAIIFSAGGFASTTGNGGGGGNCNAKAVITSPENGDTIDKETEISVEAENTDCIRRAVFLLDDQEIASAENAPYQATLDPKQFPELADGVNHSLKVVLEDTNGNRLAPLGGEVLLAFETAEIATPTQTPTGEETPVPTATPTTGKQPSLIEIQEMCKKLVKQFSGNFAYKFDQQFLQEVQKKTGEYAAAEGFFARADAYRDLINFEFHKENGLDASLPFLLAMSRSKFNAQQKNGADEGLWQLSNEFVASNGYKTPCEAESLSDAGQNCAAKTSSIYLKALVLKIFNGDAIYAVAAFGMSEQEASNWASTLPPNREDFWRIIREPRQREQAARFFAAGIVADNPQKFGMKKDKPISELYRNLIGN